MVIATFGRALMFLSLTRSSLVLMRMCSPSMSNQTGVTCGEPSGIMVARYSRAFESSFRRSRNFSGKLIFRLWVGNEEGGHFTVEIQYDFNFFLCATDRKFNLCVALECIKRA